MTSGQLELLRPGYRCVKFAAQCMSAEYAKESTEQSICLEGLLRQRISRQPLGLPLRASGW